MFKLVVKESFVRFKGTYWVNTDGRVFNSNYHSTGKWCELKYDYSRNGYKSFTICVDGKVERFLLHRVVAQLFVPNPENKPCIDHKNDDRTDSRACNLQWVTIAENNQKESKRRLLHKSNTGHRHTEESKKKISESQKARKRRSNGQVAGKRVREYREDGSFKDWDSCKEAADYYGFHKDTVSKCARGERKTAINGRRWEYIGTNENNIT